MHLGLTPWRLHSEADAESLCHQAELAESWGYDSFFLPERHFAGNLSIPEPMLLLAAVAARTRRIKLGTTSYLLPIRHPLLAAEQVACLDQLSGGRLILGLGRGYQTSMLDVFGVKQADKRTRFDDILQAMLAAWRGDFIDAGKTLTLSPQPLQQPHPPLWVAAFGPKAITQVGKLGLPYLASPMETLAELEHNHRLHRQALADAGQPQPAQVIIMRTTFICEDAGQCADIAARLPGEPRAVADYCLIGSAREVREQIRDYQQRLGMTHLIATRPTIGGIAEPLHQHSLQALQGLRQASPG